MQVMLPNSSGPVGRRSDQIESAVKLIQKTYRAKEVRARRGWIDCDEEEYIAHWRFQRGRSKCVAEEKWKVDSKGPLSFTSEAGIKKVWVQKQKEILGDDIFGVQMEKQPRELQLAKDFDQQYSFPATVQHFRHPMCVGDAVTTPPSPQIVCCWGG